MVCQAQQCHQSIVSSRGKGRCSLKTRYVRHGSLLQSISLLYFSSIQSQCIRRGGLDITVQLFQYPYRDLVPPNLSKLFLNLLTQFPQSRSVSKMLNCYSSSVIKYPYFQYYQILLLAAQHNVGCMGRAKFDIATKLL